jgi:hypothetical protein
MPKSASSPDHTDMALPIQHIAHTDQRSRHRMSLVNATVPSEYQILTMSGACGDVFLPNGGSGASGHSLAAFSRADYAQMKSCLNARIFNLIICPNLRSMITETHQSRNLRGRLSWPSLTLMRHGGYQRFASDTVTNQAIA